MALETLVSNVQAWAASFGAAEGDNCILRKNLIDLSFQEGGAYFGYVRPEEGNQGPFSDFSYVVFPAKASGACMVVLGVGSLGFKNDYELAATPGLRRKFARLISDKGFCKTSLLDIESPLPKDFTRMVYERAPHLKKTLDMYKTVRPVCELIDDPESEAGQKILKAFLAQYADIRGWASNKQERIAITNAIHDGWTPVSRFHEVLVKDLLKERRFVILQGAPGTGKTRLAKKLAATAGAEVFFTQFHAETAYSDFVYGIRPALNKDGLTYVSNKGILYKAIEYAAQNKDKPVYLIVDEINRANLANVLGPVFYLFEYQMADSPMTIDIGEGLKISSLPKNLFFIGTMNTADRSLAVVDFALRRRFAWYLLPPEPIGNPDSGLVFFQDDFNAFTDIFEWYSTDEALNLQPGQGYFIAENDEAMKARIRYELMPLIKEYLAEGLLLKAKDSFSDYFYKRIGEFLCK